MLKLFTTVFIVSLELYFANAAERDGKSKFITHSENVLPIIDLHFHIIIASVPPIDEDLPLILIKAEDLLVLPSEVHVKTKKKIDVAEKRNTI